MPTVIWSESVQNLEELGKGNNVLLPSFDIGNTNQLNKVTSEPIPNDENTTIELPTNEKMDEASDGTTESHMVMYKGALVDVAKLLQQLNRSEKAREETEIRLSELSKTHNELQSSNTKAKDKLKDLQSELKSCNRKVGDVESSLSNANVRDSYFLCANVKCPEIEYENISFFSSTEKMQRVLFNFVWHS